MSFISYYGGKQKMLRHILPLIPEHKIYTEAFFGGGAVFFAKEPSEAEIINDINSMAICFYKTARNNFDELKAKIEATPFSRAIYKVAMDIYRAPHLFNDVQKAWSFYVGTNAGFSSKIGSWGYDKHSKRVTAWVNKQRSFDESIVERLKHAQIESNEAHKVIESRDDITAFHYVDPPYINTNQGHYSGYSEDDYRTLLDTLAHVKGKFLLSGYPNHILDRYIKQYGWHIRTFDKSLSAKKAVDGKRLSRKTEVLVANYPIGTNS